MIANGLTRLMLALVLMLIFTGRIHAQSCISESQAREAAAKSDGSLQVLDDIGSRAAILFYDSVPPEGESGATIAALVHLGDGSGVVLVGRGGVFCGSLRVSAGQWRAVVAAILGERS